MSKKIVNTSTPKNHIATFSGKDGEVIMEYQEKLKCIFVQDKDRKKGFFHVIGVGDTIGRRKGIVIEQSLGKIYAIHVILFLTGFKKRKFTIDFEGKSIDDYPLYWCRLTWMTSLWWKSANIKRLIGSFEIQRGVSAETMR